MGYDCTLHAIDPQAITDRFVPRLLGHVTEFDPFDERDDAKELWATVRRALKGEPVDGAELGLADIASMVAQLAIAFCAAEHPYHYERGFCLALWPEQPEKWAASIPKKFRGNSELLFAAVVEAFPKLKGQFPQEIASNFYPGFFVLPDNVPPLLKWVEKRVKGLKKPDRRLFRGLLLVLQHAARHGLAYWEGTDLPVPMATMRPPAEGRRHDLEEVISPDGVYLECCGEFDQFVAFADGTGFPQDCRTLIADFGEWPPSFKTWNEYAKSAGRSRDGRWVTASMTSDREYMYRCRVGEGSTNSKTVLLPGEEGENGVEWCSFWNDHIIAVLALGPSKPSTLLIADESILRPYIGLPVAPEKFPTFGVVQLGNGEDVLIWQGDGYCLRDGKLSKDYSMSADASGGYSWSAVPYGVDGFFYLSHEQRFSERDDYGQLHEHFVAVLFSIEPSGAPVRHMPKMINVRRISPGPNQSLLLKEGNFGSGDIGKLYFPADDEYVRLEAELFEDEDPDDIRSLHWMASCDRLIAATPDRLWAVPTETVLRLPRYRASTGRRRRS